MTTIGKISLPDNADRLLLITAAETRLWILSQAADSLLQKTADVDPATAQSLRGQAVHLFAACHNIVRLLSIGDLEGACGVSADDNLDGATLGPTA